MGGKAKFVDDGTVCEAGSPDSKECGHCKKWKQLSYFYKKAGAKFGVTTDCKQCSTSKRERNEKAGKEHVARICCNDCGEDKPAEAFGLNKQTPTGRNAKCKDCVTRKDHQTRVEGQKRHGAAEDMTCKLCKTTMPPGNFRFDSGSVCNKCRLARDKAYRDAHPSWRLRV